MPCADARASGTRRSRTVIESGVAEPVPGRPAARRLSLALASSRSTLGGMAGSKWLLWVAASVFAVFLAVVPSFIQPKAAPAPDPRLVRRGPRHLVDKHGHAKAGPTQPIQKANLDGKSASDSGFVDLALADLWSSQTTHRHRAASMLAQVEPTERRDEVAKALEPLLS